MKKVIVTLVAGLVASAAYAQAPATTSQTEPAKEKAPHPVKATIKPEPDVSAAVPPDPKTADETSKTEKHKKPKAHKKAAKSEPAESKTEPAAETR